MADNGEDLQKTVLIHFMYLDAIFNGILLGLFFGLGIFLSTNYLILKGGSIVGPHLALLGQFFIGYEVTFVGSLIGLGYGLVFGFFVGYSFSRLYNWIANYRDRGTSGAP